MTIQDMKENIARVFLFTGRVSHLIDPYQPRLPDETSERLRAMCGTKPYWPGVWFGTQDGDREKAEELPLCKTCEMMGEAISGVEPA